MTPPVEAVRGALTAGLRRASLFDGANQADDWYVARAASSASSGYMCF